jgi:hypothetical protein
VDKGLRRFNRLRRAEFDVRFPGLLALVLAEGARSSGTSQTEDSAEERQRIGHDAAT